MSQLFSDSNIELVNTELNDNSMSSPNIETGPTTSRTEFLINVEEETDDESLVKEVKPKQKRKSIILLLFFYCLKFIYKGRPLYQNFSEAGPYVRI